MSRHALLCSYSDKWRFPCGPVLLCVSRHQDLDSPSENVLDSNHQDTLDFSIHSS